MIQAVNGAGICPHRSSPDDITCSIYALVERDANGAEETRDLICDGRKRILNYTCSIYYKTETRTDADCCSVPVELAECHVMSDLDDEKVFFRRISSKSLTSGYSLSSTE